MGLLVLDLMAFSFPGLLGDLELVCLAYCGAYVHGAPIWVTLLLVSLLLESKPRLAAAISVLTGIVAVVFGYLALIISLLGAEGW